MELKRKHYDDEALPAAPAQRSKERKKEVEAEAPTSPAEGPEGSEEPRDFGAPVQGSKERKKEVHTEAPTSPAAGSKEPKDFCSHCCMGMEGRKSVELQRIWGCKSKSHPLIPFREVKTIKKWYKPQVILHQLWALDGGSKC